jgi:hypothetical protein
MEMEVDRIHWEFLRLKYQLEREAEEIDKAKG